MEGNFNRRLNNSYIIDESLINMANNLQTGLYKAIVTLKSDLEADWAIGLRGNGYDLPTMAAGCEYAGLTKICSLLKES